MLQALITSRTVVLSLLNQLGVNCKEDQLKRLVRKCALDLVARKPIIDVALRPDVRHVGRKATKSFAAKSKEAVSSR